MFVPQEVPQNKTEMYDLLEKQLASLLAEEPSPIPNLANMAALLYHTLPDLNWAGFYLLVPSKQELLLGPFQGLPACIRIPMGKGVCGTAALLGKTQVVPNVHAFKGHIACDGATNSEIVIPFFEHGSLLGVLDLDSPLLNRFDETDRLRLEAVCRMLVLACKWPIGG